MKPLFGVQSIDEPIVNVPAGAKVRLRIRREDFVLAFVRHEGRVSEWAVCRDTEGHIGPVGSLVLAYKQGENVDSALASTQEQKVDAGSAGGSDAGAGATEDRAAEDELNCAEEWLDHYAAQFDLAQTSFDCIGDYIKAVVEAARGAAHSAAGRAVIAERVRQVALGFDASHDDGYTAGELPLAAASYLAAVVWPQIFKPANPPMVWPWTADWWKPRAARDNLVRAAALTIAEIERLDRKAAQLEQLHRNEGGAQHG